MKKKLLGMILVLIIGSFLVINYFIDDFYTARDFDIEVITSSIDFDQDGIDDYSDFVIGAKKDADNYPKYDDAYVSGGYPNNDVGVCTDVIWRAFKEAGYNLKDMIDLDIETYPQDYPHIEAADKNIDFRRVPNQHIFFKKYAQELTLDKNDIASWQPGDIVIFNNNDHVGIVSDKRTKEGITYIYHNGGQLKRHENYLENSTIIGHFRFDANKIVKSLLISW